MPEFILAKGSAADSQRFADLAPFVRGYIEAMFFTNQGDRDDILPEEATFADLAPEALESIIEECEAFQKHADKLLSLAYTREHKGVAYDEEAAGRDFWYTRNGHGVGFWDREALECDVYFNPHVGQTLDPAGAEHSRGSLGRLLSDLCGWRTNFTERTPYMGDDDLIHYCEG